MEADSSITSEFMLLDAIKTETDSESSNQWFVEKILNHRREKGKMQYLIQWRSYLESYKSWEPIENINCGDIFLEYEKERKKKRDERIEMKRNARKERESINGSAKSKLRGFDRGLAPEKIIGGTDALGSPMFLMKWEGEDNANLVLSKEANRKCPKVVIAYYEKHLKWNNLGKLCLRSDSNTSDHD